MLEGVLGAGRHRLGGQRPRLHAGRQDRNRAGGRKRHLLGDQVRRLLHRLRPGPGPAAAGRGDRRRAAGRNLRRLGRGARPSARSPHSRCPTSGVPRRNEGAAARGAPDALPRIGRDETGRARRGRPRRSESSATPRVEVAGLAYDSRKVEPGTLFFCVVGREGRRARVRGRGRSRRGRRRWWSSASCELGVPQVVVAGRAGGDGAAGGAVLGRPDRGAAGGRGHRDERQDDDRLPAPRGARGGRRSSAGCWGR